MPDDDNVGRIERTSHTSRLAHNNRALGIVAAGHSADDVPVNA
jgi:hypothetical protein